MAASLAEYQRGISRSMGKTHTTPKKSSLTSNLMRFSPGSHPELPPRRTAGSPNLPEMGSSGNGKATRLGGFSIQKASHWPPKKCPAHCLWNQDVCSFRPGQNLEGYCSLRPESFFARSPFSGTCASLALKLSAIPGPFPWTFSFNRLRPVTRPQSFRFP